MLANVLHKRTPISHGVEKILIIVRCSITAKSRKVQGDENILLLDFLKRTSDEWVMWPRRYFSAVSVEIRLCCNYMASGHLHESWVLCCGMMLKKEKNMAILCCFNNDNFRSIFYGLPTDASTGISKFFTLKMCIACMTKANILVNWKEHNIPCFDNHKIKLNIFGRSIRVEVNCWRSDVQRGRIWFVSSFKKENKKENRQNMFKELPTNWNNFQTGKSYPAVTIHRLLVLFSSCGILARLSNVLRFLNYLSKGRRLSFAAQALT